MACCCCALVPMVIGCSSTSNGVMSLQARGAIGLESAGLIAGAAVVGAPDFHEQGTANGLGYGLGASINTPVIDVIGGLDDRIHDHEDVPEVSVGLRKRFGPGESPVYLFATARSDRSYTDGEESFNGFALGGGLIIQFQEHWFIDLNMAWEHTEHLALQNSTIDDAVFQLGIGFSL